MYRIICWSCFHALGHYSNRNAMAGSFGTIEKADFAANVAVDAGESWGSSEDVNELL